MDQILKRKKSRYINRANGDSDMALSDRDLKKEEPNRYFRSKIYEKNCTNNRRKTELKYCKVFYIV